MKFDDIKELKKLKLTNYKLLQIKLIKNKIYKKNHYLQNIKVKDIELRLKKALYIIYLYTLHSKRILFVGGSLEIYKHLKKALYNTKHAIVPELGWTAGIITNKRSSVKSLLKKQNNISNFSKNLLTIKEKPDLIVILDEPRNKTALYEGYLSNVPIITLNDSFNIFNIHSSYKIPGNFYFNKKIPRNNFFLLLLRAVVRRSIITSKKYSKVTYKLNTIKKLKTPGYQRRKHSIFRRNNRYYNKKSFKHGKKNKIHNSVQKKK